MGEKETSEMWGLLVLAVALAVGASDNDTAVEEELDIARGKLLVCTDGHEPRVVCDISAAVYIRRLFLITFDPSQRRMPFCFNDFLSSCRPLQAPSVVG